jgi:superoxide dismutase, Cu-Zn family
MRSGWLAVAVFGLAVAGVQAQKPGVVKVDIKNGTGESVGSATFKTVKKGVSVKIEVKNLPVGVHGVHIHQNASCEGPDFKSAGGHFNPDGKQHGFDNPMGHHNGDLPQNLTVQENHVGEATFVVTSISLDKAAPNSLFLNGGTSIVIHEKADDMKTDPSGNSGNRIACGLIQ